MRVAAMLVALLALLAGGGSRAAEPAFPILDVTAVPYLKPQGRAAYADFLLINLPRAMAVASNGGYGWYGGAGSIETARARAMKSCADKGGTDCAIYAEDLQVVWHDRPPVALPPAPPPLLQNRDFALVPDARYFWFGPQIAKGVIVWAHGKSAGGQDLREEQPQGFVRVFNNAGFDVVRFARAPAADYPDQAADWLRQGLAALRQQGWRMVVMSGQSRGAWNSLQMLDTPGLVDAVIAISPASFSSQATQESDLYRILRGDRSPAARVAVAQFTGDIYVRDMAGRLAMLRELLPSRTPAALVIGEPEGFTGHSGGYKAEFARIYGPCLLRFITDRVPPTGCEGR